MFVLIICEIKIKILSEERERAFSSQLVDNLIRYKNGKYIFSKCKKNKILAETKKMNRTLVNNCDK